MPFSTAPSLLLGLSARIFIDKFISTREPSIRDFILLGLWQGVGLYYAYQNSTELATVAILAIGANLVFEFEQDVTKCACSLLGIGLAVVFTDVLSKFVGDGLYDIRSAARHSHATTPKDRVVQFRGVEGDGHDSRRRRRHHRTSRQAQTVSDITSLDSTSDMWPNTTMSVPDREIAALRARAALADSERRRYKEEKKWALSQGNRARASQMSWQVKRYAALMQSFHREADARVVEASNGRPAPVEPPPPRTSRDRTSRTQNHDTVNERHASTTNGDPGGSHKKQQSGNLKSATRTHAR